MGKRLHEIVDSCLEIDLKEASQAYKRQKISSDSDGSSQMKRQLEKEIESQRKV